MKLTCVAALASLTLAAPSLAAQEPQADGPRSHARVTSDSAGILNMPDAKAAAVQRPAAGTLLAVYRDTGQWLEVEVPGGYAVWVFGRYLSETADADVYRVNGNGVNLRPRPEGGVANYPLSQQLYAGDEVRVIERFDPALPLAADWVRIWSPAGVRAWIAKDQVTLLLPDEDADALWAQVLAGLAPSRGEELIKVRLAPPSTPTEVPADAEEESGNFDGAIEAAWKSMESQRAKSTPDWPAVRALFGDAEEAAISGADVAQVRQGLEAVAALEEASMLRAKLMEERLRREEAARREQERVWAESREKDPLGGVFLVRGALEGAQRGEGETARKQYFVKFGQELVAEVVCVSGRYDLDLFVGYQVGVRGTQLRSAEEGGLQHIEVTRLEVIARRP